MQIVGFPMECLIFNRGRHITEPPHKKTKENKHTDQLCSNCTADHCAVTAQLISTFVSATHILQFLFFITPKFQDSSQLLCAQAGLCLTWLGTKIVGFLVRRLIYDRIPFRQLLWYHLVDIAWVSVITYYMDFFYPVTIER